MAATSLLALLDDIATMLDDIALMTKSAASRTAAVLGDDLAVNAEQVSGVTADRELPVVWAVAKGSLLNKVILIPIALGLSVFADWAILPLLLLGGLYLCFEGAEKVFHSKNTKKSTVNHEIAHRNITPERIAQFETEKVKGAIRTDFVLSIEIIVITLGTVATETLQHQFMVLTIIAVLATVGVYGLVAIIVKLDDAGLWLLQRQGQQAIYHIARKLGDILVKLAPYLMKLLTLVGTIAMFLVGGGIISHAVHSIAHFSVQMQLIVSNTFHFEGFLLNAYQLIMPLLSHGLIGLIAGALLFFTIPTLVNSAKAVLNRKS